MKTRGRKSRQLLDGVGATGPPPRILTYPNADDGCLFARPILVSAETGESSEALTLLATMEPDKRIPRALLKGSFKTQTFLALFRLTPCFASLQVARGRGTRTTRTFSVGFLKKKKLDLKQIFADFSF